MSQDSVRPIGIAVVLAFVALAITTLACFAHPLAVERDGLRRQSLDDSVAAAQVIFVGTAMDAAVAPPNVPGDAPEHLIRYKVTRVLKGKLADEFTSVRTPTAPAEFIGKEWVIMLSPEFVAGKHRFAGTYTIKLEPEIKAILAGGAKKP